MLFLSIITVFLLETSDTRTADTPSNDINKINISIPSYNGPGSSLVNQSIDGLKQLQKDLDLSPFTDNLSKEESKDSSEAQINESDN